MKDPFRAVRAIARLQGDYEVVQVGGALDPAMTAVARGWAKARAALPLDRQRAARQAGWIARSHLLVVSSVMEGGANVICEPRASARRCSLHAAWATLSWADTSGTTGSTTTVRCPRG